MKVIGLTGGIGSGKSTVARFLEELGAVVLDADKVGHEALKPGSEAWKKVVNEFGNSIITGSGDIDRTRLGEMVFNDAAARERLNRITHPVIYGMVGNHLEAYRKKGIKIVVLETALLMEVGTGQVDEIWVTVAPNAVILKRIMERTGLSEEAAQARIQAQLSNDERIKHADVIIDTNSSLDELKKGVAQLWQDLLSRYTV